MKRLIKNCRAAQISAMFAWLVAVVLHLFAESVLSLVVLWVSGTVMWTLSIVLLYLERAVTQNGARQLEALQMTYHATRQACENADYESIESLERALQLLNEKK